jgi:hypothetical protein
MKKSIAVVMALVFLAFTSFAQNATFGIKAGYNAASLEVDGGTDYDSRSAMHGGFLAHIHVTNHFAVQPELVFSMQGGESGSTKLKMNYINVPVLLQYMNSGFRIQTGPQIGFLVSAESKVGNIEVDVDDAFDSIDFSWAIGAGYLFPAGIGIDARYNIGISDISDDPDFEVRNRVFQVGLFYQFNTGTVKK